MSLGFNTIAKSIVSVTKLRQTLLKIRQTKYVKQSDCSSPVFSPELLAAKASAEQEHHTEAVFALSKGLTSTGGCRCPRASRDGGGQAVPPTPWQTTAVPSQETEGQHCTSSMHRSRFLDELSITKILLGKSHRARETAQ